MVQSEIAVQISLTYEESVQAQLLEKGDISSKVFQPIIHEGVKRPLAVQAVDNALDEKLHRHVSKATWS